MVSRPAPPSPRQPRKHPLHSVSDGRHAALEVLVLLEQGAQVQAALDRYLRGATLKPQDRGLCTELVYGFLRAEIRIDHLLQRLLRNPQKLPREMYLALGMALYALLFLERIPPHATVDWTVGHVRRRFGETLSKVANGALRTFVRLGDAPKNVGYYSAADASPAANLSAESLFYALPAWIGTLWDKAYGPEQRRALCQRSLKAPYAGVRVNALSDHAQELYAALLQIPDAAADCGQAVGYSGVAFGAGRSPRAVANAPLSYWQQQGDISFQSAGSQCVMQALAPQTWPSPVWDICAGQGGKSAILIEQGCVVALCTDVHGLRLESFTGNMQRLASAFGQNVPTAVPSDASDTAPANVPRGLLRPCTQPNSAQLAAARSQALHVLDSVEAACGQKVPLLAYPPAHKTKKPLDEAGYDPWREDDACAAALSARTQDTVPMADSAQDADDGRHAPAEAPQDRLSPALPPLTMPLVALLDGCAAPPNSWAGTICIDAPCSGLGILSRRPDIRRHRSAESLSEVVHLQATLLEAAWRALQVGGGLVYMTCTLNPAENEEQIQRLLRSHPTARLVRQWQTDHHHPWLEGMYGAYCVKDAPVG